MTDCVVITNNQPGIILFVLLVSSDPDWHIPFILFLLDILSSLFAKDCDMNGTTSSTNAIISILLLCITVVPCARYLDTSGSLGEGHASCFHDVYQTGSGTNYIQRDWWEDSKDKRRQCCLLFKPIWWLVCHGGGDVGIIFSMTGNTFHSSPMALSMGMSLVIFQMEFK